jgi:hypothetical protein
MQLHVQLSRKCAATTAGFIGHLFCVYAGTRFENKRLTTPYVDKWFVGYGMNNDTGMMYVLLSSTSPAAVATHSSLPVIPPGLCLFAVAVLKWLLTPDGVGVSLFIKSAPPAGDVFAGVSMAKHSLKYADKWQVRWSRIPKDPGTDFKVKLFIY